MADEDVKTASDATTDQSPEGAAGAAEDPQKVIEDLRRRQSGADKARDIAIAERDEVRRQLEALASGKPGSQSDNSGETNEQYRARVDREYAEKLAKQTEAIRAATLDKAYPTARVRYPEITDEAKLAELEEYFKPSSAPKPPIGNNPAATAGTKSLDDMSIAELKKTLDTQLSDILKAR